MTLHEPATTTAQDEAGLIEALKRGDGAAFEQVLRLHGPRLLASAQRILKDADEAQDCLQETMINAFRKIEGFEGRSSLSTWLHRIIINAALARRRKKSGNVEQPIDDLQPQFDDEGFRLDPGRSAPVAADDLLEREEIRTLVREKIDGLPETHRNILILRDIEELETGEIAAMLEISEGAVKVRVHRARAALKAVLEPVWSGDADEF